MSPQFGAARSSDSNMDKPKPDIVVTRHDTLRNDELVAMRSAGGKNVLKVSKFADAPKAANDNELHAGNDDNPTEEKLPEKSFTAKTKEGAEMGALKLVIDRQTNEARITNFYTTRRDVGAMRSLLKDAIEFLSKEGVSYVTVKFAADNEQALQEHKEVLESFGFHKEERADDKRDLWRAKVQVVTN